GYATNILQLYEESKEIITHQTVGTMTIGTIETLAAFFLPPFLQRFRQMHPSMNLLLQPGNEATLIQAVREGEYDTGFLLDELCTDPDLYCVPIREEELVIIAHPKHKICARSTVTINDLAKETLILTEDGCTYRAMLLRALQQNGISYQLSFECGSLEAIKQCVIYSLGIALLPRMTVNSEVEQGQVIAMPFACPHPKFYTQLIYRKKKWVSRALQDFIGLFEEVGKNRI